MPGSIPPKMVRSSPLFYNVFSYSCLQVGVPGSILAYFVIVSLGYSIMLVLRF